VANAGAMEFVFQESSFEVDDDGYFSGSAQYSVTNIPTEGLVIQAYLELNKEKSLALVSEITEDYLTSDNDHAYISVSGVVDGNALPDTFVLHYRVFKVWDSIEATPSLPSSFGEQTVSVSPKGLLGGTKWKCGGNHEVTSILVHNDSGDFSVSTNIQAGKTANDSLAVVAINETNDTAEQFVISRSRTISIKNQYASGAENLLCRYRFYKPDKWQALDKYNVVNVERS